MKMSNGDGVHHKPLIFKLMTPVNKSKRMKLMLQNKTLFECYFTNQLKLDLSHNILMVSFEIFNLKIKFKMLFLVYHLKFMVGDV